MARRVSTRSTESDNTTSGDLGLPTDEEVRAVRMKTGQASPKVFSKRNGLVTVNVRRWLPQDAHDLQLRTIIHAHCGDAGNRGASATESIV